MLKLKGNRSVWSRLLHVLVQASLAGGHKTERSTRRGNRIGTRGGGIMLCGRHDDSQHRERQRREHAVRHAHAHRMDFRPQQDGYYHIQTEETMMKLTLAGLALALALFTVIPAHAQQPDETPGQQVQITGANLPAGGYSCGRATYPTYCYGIPADVGGTFWLDVYTNAYPSPTGFIAFNNVLDLGQASITSAIPIKNSVGQVTQLDVSFTGLTNDGDSGTYVGTATFHFTYTKMVGGSGRGGGYPGYLMYLAGYTMKITYS